MAIFLLEWAFRVLASWLKHCSLRWQPPVTSAKQRWLSWEVWNEFGFKRRKYTWQVPTYIWSYTHPFSLRFIRHFSCGKCLEQNGHWFIILYGLGVSVRRNILQWLCTSHAADRDWAMLRSMDPIIIQNQQKLLCAWHEALQQDTAISFTLRCDWFGFAPCDSTVTNAQKSPHGGSFLQR